MNACVLDTSTLIAGLLSRRGPAATLVDAFFAGRLILYYTAPTLAEYAEVMERPKFQIEPTERMAILLKLRTSGMLVEPARVPRATWPDPDDLPFVAAALATEEKIVVTRNPGDLAPSVEFGVRVLAPAEAAMLLR